MSKTNNILFKALKKELDGHTKRFEKLKEKLHKQKEKATIERYEVRNELMKEIKKACPHEKETYHDTWHPHTRDGDQYHERKV